MSAKRKNERRTKRRPPPEPAGAPFVLGRQIALFATIALAGIAWVAIEESVIGALVTLAGVLALMFAVHRYGRLGEEGRRASRPKRRRA